ncbi:hypothetical protein [Streptomyces coryli]|nr:hypothetical protein [Streptomyces coryli]
MTVLRNAAAGYRAAATAAGLDWPEPAAPPTAAPELVHRLFDVDHVAEQLTWLQSQGWDAERLLPGGGLTLPWPADGDALDDLSLSIGVPFPWRQQLPLFHFEYLFFTFVLAGDHEGEIWRYEIPPDTWDAVPAAPSLAALFSQWTRGIETGAVRLDPSSGWLMVGSGTGNDYDTIRELQELDPGLDPLAFPISMPNHPLLRARQAAAGVDTSCVTPERAPEIMEELMDEIAAVRGALGV